MAMMIDYLCLRLGWTTDQVLDNAHFDNERKITLYLAFDEYEKTRLLPAIPLGFDTKVTKEMTARSKKAIDNLNSVVKGTGFGNEDEKKNELLEMFGGEKGVAKFFRAVKDETIPMKRIFGR